METLRSLIRAYQSFVEGHKRVRLLRDLIFLVVVVRCGGCLLWGLYDKGSARILRDAKQALVVNFFAALRYIPFVQRKIDSEIKDKLADVRKSIIPESPQGVVAHVELPEKGLSDEEILAELNQLQHVGNTDYREGKVSGTVYHAGKDITRISTKAYKLFIWSNPLHPDVFPGVRKMEAEIVAMVVKMYNGDAEACGTTTSGGTESILMACKAYREWAKKKKGITKPELVVPSSVHCAFDKACHYFGIKLIHIPINEKSGKVDLHKVRKAITSNTIALVGSAPNYPHGVIDDIQGLAALARRYKIGLHVDCCLGGFLLPFMQKAGFPVAPFDFSVPGVTSISCDTHKYGFAPKGSSVVLYANKELRSCQYFVAPNWPGGIYASPTIAGSRAGALLAACWATLLQVGEEGYVAATREIIGAARKIAVGLEGIHGIKLIGYPEVSVVSWYSDDFDIYRLGEMMSAKGWRLSNLQYPSALHYCVTYANKDTADAFVADVTAAAQELMQTPTKKAEGAGAIYGVAQAIPDRSLIDQLARGYIDVLFET